MIIVETSPLCANFLIQFEFQGIDAFRCGCYFFPAIYLSATCEKSTNLQIFHIITVWFLCRKSVEIIQQEPQEPSCEQSKREPLSLENFTGAKFEPQLSERRYIHRALYNHLMKCFRR